MKQNVVFITGASAGLGLALAREHAAKGDQVALFARRNTAPLAKALGGLALRGDVARRADLDRAVRSILKRFGRIDIVYANAGYGERGRIDELDLLRWRRQQAVNVEGALNTVWACLPALKASRGRLGLVGSVLGLGGIPGNGAYVASKFALRGLSQSLYAELKPEGVSVTYLAPGFFESEFRHRRADGSLDLSLPDTAPQGWRISAAEAARNARRAVMARQREKAFPLHGILSALLYRLMPGAALALAAFLRRRRINKP